MDLDKALRKVFEESAEFLPADREGFLQKVRALSRDKQSIDLLYPVLCEEIFDMIAEIKRLKDDNAPEDMLQRKARRAICEAVDILGGLGISSIYKLEEIIGNLFFMVGMDVEICDKNTLSPDSKVNGKDIIVTVALPQDTKGEKKQWTPSYGEQTLFRAWFCVVMLVWSFASIIILVAMGLQVASGISTNSTYLNWSYVTNSGIILLLIVAGGHIMPLMKKSYESSVKSKNKNQELLWRVHVDEGKKKSQQGGSV